jgi:hypothetical protein
MSPLVSGKHLYLKIDSEIEINTEIVSDPNRIR